MRRTSEEDMREFNLRKNKSAQRLKNEKQEKGKQNQQTERQKKQSEKMKQKEKEKIRRERVFPFKNTIFIALIGVLQIACIVFAVLFQPSPTDVIEEYRITVEPLEDGSLDIEYYFEWTPLDMFEYLTWVEIGMPNEDFEIYQNSLSDEIEYSKKEITEEGYCYADIYFKNEYKHGETLSFSFKVNQKRMLCSKEDSKFYSMVPGWFNSTPIKNYTFRWKCDGAYGSNCDRISDSYYVWEGTELDPGATIEMNIKYPKDSFPNQNTVNYGQLQIDATNELKETKHLVIGICVVLFIVGLIIETIIIDSYVSYSKGRGFIKGYGHHMHVYGRVNPVYIRAKNMYNASHKSGGSHGSGGGCACACACACAGGGRAGCSQKDMYKITD